MRRKGSFRNDYAVSEVVGGIILIMVAVASFAVIYTHLFPALPETNINNLSQPALPIRFVDLY